MWKSLIVVAALTCSSLLGLSALAGDTESGVALYEQKKYAEAADHLRAALESDQNDRRARYYLAQSLIELKQYKEAEEVLRTPVEAPALEALGEQAEPSEGTPSEAQMKIALGRAEIGQEKFTEARQDLEAAKELAPDNAEAYLRLGELELNRKDYPAAAKELDRAVELEPGNAYAHYYAGIAYSNLKRPDKMIDHFQHFLKLAPDAPEAAKVQSLMRSLRR